MNSWIGALAGALVSCVAAAAAFAASPPPSAVYVTTFVEVLPGSANAAAADLRDYRAATRRESGLLESDVYQEAGWPSRLFAYEVWQDMPAYEAHRNGAARSTLADRLKPIEYGPPDARIHYAHFVSEKDATPAAGAVFVLSHLDVTPNRLPDLLGLMKPLTENSATEPGAEIYEIIRQGNMPNIGNHFRLFEVWSSEKAWEDHNMAAHTQAFRTGLAPLLGTPYDQRKYIRLN